MTHPLTDKLWEQMPHMWTKERLDTLITDFMKSHDEELKREWMNCGLWGIEKRREQCEWLLKNFDQPKSLIDLINEAFGLEPEKSAEQEGDRLREMMDDPETQSQECPFCKLEQIADLKKRVEAIEEWLPKGAKKPWER